jgi:hypothetical protein
LSYDRILGDFQLDWDVSETGIVRGEFHQFKGAPRRKVLFFGAIGQGTRFGGRTGGVRRTM